MCKLRVVILTLAVGAALAISATSASAQGYGNGSYGGPANLQYTPRPTLSPYLNLYNNPGGYASYQQYVRPFLEQNDVNAQQQAAVNQLQSQLNQVRSTSGLGVTGTGGRINPTGHPAEYMYYSHYYGQMRH